MPRWPENPDDDVDPAIAPLIEAGEGESEGFDVAEADLIRHAEHGDQQGTDPIWRDAAGFRAEESRDSTTTATARATTRTRKPDRASRCHEAADAAGRVATPRLKTDLDVIPLGDRGMRRGRSYVRRRVRAPRGPPRLLP